MLFRQITDALLAQHAYLIGCQKTGEALLIDPERDVDRYVEAAASEGLRVTAVAETHVHADFLSGARQLAEDHGAALYLPAEQGGWSARWAKGSGYDVTFLADGDTFAVGHVEVRAVHAPGHTPEHLAFLVTDRGGGAEAPMGLAAGDFVFAGSLGRPDLLETAAGQQGAMQDGADALFDSAQQFLALDDFLQVWPGHGAGSSCGKALGSVPSTTVGYERRFSPALAAAQTGRDAFARFMLDGQSAPPLYFARMKALNRDGVPLLEALPAPRPLSAGDLAGGAARNATVIDARPERASFMNGHLRKALYLPFGKSFPTLAGSYVDPERPVVLVIEEAHVEAAVRALVRVGIDRISGYVTPEVLAGYAALGDAAPSSVLETIPVIDAREMEAARRGERRTQVVDVRSRAEYRAGHVPGAALAPHNRLPEHLDALPKDETLLVHCGSGQRAASAVSLLQARGFDVRYVNDYFSNWPGVLEEEDETVAAA